MSETLRRVQTLVLTGDFLISDHGFDELAKDGILPGHVIAGMQQPLRSRTIRTACAARAFWPCNTMGMVDPYTLSGESRPVGAVLRYS